MGGILHLKQRPATKFDPANKDHRRYYRDYLKHHHWGECPVRFIADDFNGVLTAYIDSKILNYYISKEFDKE